MSWRIESGLTRRVRRYTLLVVMPLCAPAHAAVTSCTVTATSVAFGTYTPLTPAPLTSTGTISLICTVTTRKNTVTIDLSTGASNSFAPRTLTSAANSLNYNLYLDAALTQIWGNGTGSSLEDSFTITRTRGTNQTSATATVFGAVAALQDPFPGSYSDTITVTVNF
jgi:spore coat protein U-like protein